MIKLTEYQREILQALLDGKDIERYNATNDAWDIVKNYDYAIYHLYQGNRIRIKPRTIIVNGVEVPEPMKVRPERGTIYYTAGTNPGVSVKWCNDTFDEDYFNAGICHNTPYAATLHWEAMIKPSRVN